MRVPSGPMNGSFVCILRLKREPLVMLEVLFLGDTAGEAELRLIISSSGTFLEFSK